jgi:hypothetical protein
MIRCSGGLSWSGWGALWRFGCVSCGDGVSRRGGARFAACRGSAMGAIEAFLRLPMIVQPLLVHLGGPIQVWCPQAIVAKAALVEATPLVPVWSRVPMRSWPGRRASRWMSRATPSRAIADAASASALSP